MDKKDKIIIKLKNKIKLLNLELLKAKNEIDYLKNKDTFDNIPVEEKQIIDFSKHVKVKNELKEFLNLQDNYKITRVEITKKFYNYIDEKKLKKYNNSIIPDEKLIKLFKIKQSDFFSYYSLQKYINQLIHR